MSENADMIARLERFKDEAKLEYPEIIAALRTKYNADDPARVWTRDDLELIIADLIEESIQGRDMILAVAAAVREKP